MLTVPHSPASESLQMDEVQTELANGELMQADIVGSIEMRFQNRKVTVDAVVMDA
ncbi:MAG: hypothetical protein AAF609_05930 [Cyanobacteria bacterium P01_C01_bin.120]